jgi:hypothetical protein
VWRIRPIQNPCYAIFGGDAATQGNDMNVRGEGHPARQSTRQLDVAGRAAAAGDALRMDARRDEGEQANFDEDGAG